MCNNERLNLLEQTHTARGTCYEGSLLYTLFVLFVENDRGLRAQFVAISCQINENSPFSFSLTTHAPSNTTVSTYFTLPKTDGHSLKSINLHFFAQASNIREPIIRHNESKINGAKVP